MRILIKMEAVGRQVQLVLEEAGSHRMVAVARWEDRRDLSQKFFQKLEDLLVKNDLSVRDIGGMEFSCDSPYFARRGKWQEMRLEELDGTGKCGFTAWQTGEMIMKAMNFAVLE